MFSDIHNFKNTADYLPILNGALIADIIFIMLLYFGAFKSKYLQKWYRELSLSAVIADTLILVIGIIIARFLYHYIFTEYSLLKFIALALGIQIIHDILFYLLFISVPRGKSRILDIFKDYGKEVGYRAIKGDSLMMLLTVLIASYLKGFSLNANIITLIVAAYLVPYAIYTV